MTPRTLSDAERLDWLRLARTPGLGPITVIALVSRYRSATAAIEALPELARRGGRRTPIDVCSAAEARRERDAAASHGARLVAACEPDYPPLLRHIDAAPPVLCVHGDPAIFARPAVAVVGARNASAAGLALARSMAADLAAAGIAVVSGLARGVDTAAHRAALASGTIAAIAGGIDVTYPPENADLQRKIAETGAVITEMPPGTRPTARHFPRRNRLISGMAIGVLVVEAAERSGSLITARLAAEQGREVFAVPGSPLDPRSAGANRLIRSGAQLVTCAADILAAIDPIIPAELAARRDDPAAEGAVGGHGTGDEDGEHDAAATVEPDERDRVLGLLSPAPVPVDDLIAESGLPARIVHTILLELDLAGRLERPGAGTVSMI